jgi:predicted DCC family thiol-disulfide oxidoreductase YuxK
MNAEPPQNYLLYDGECPACRSYLAISRLRELRPDLAVLDARQKPALVAVLCGRGYEINEGMVLALDGRMFFGAEVTRMVALFGEAHPPPRRLLLVAIGAAPWSRWLYPWLNRGRQLLLRMLGRGLIG